MLAIILVFLILGETLVFFSICLETPFILVALCRLKHGEIGPLVIRRIGIVLFAVLVFWVYKSVAIFYSCKTFHAPINWSDAVSLYVFILQASLVGLSLFVWMVLEKLHHVIMEQYSVTDIIKTEETLLQARKLCMEDRRRVLLVNIAKLTAKMKKLEMDCKIKTNRAEAAGAVVLELKNRFEELRLQYDRLLDYNQALRNQLQSIGHEVQKIDETDGESVDFENVVETTMKCGDYLVSPTHLSSSPRHRRPMFQC